MTRLGASLWLPVCAALALTLGGATPARAETKPTLSQQAAAAMVRLHTAGQKGPLHQQAGSTYLDTWIVALRLAMQGRQDVATVLAKVPVPHVEGLTERLAAWAKAPVSPELTSAFDAAEHMYRGKRWAELRALTLPDGGPPALTALLHFWQGRAWLQVVFDDEHRQRTTKAEVLERGAALCQRSLDIAREIGWVRGTGDAAWGLGHFEARRLRYVPAVNAWMRCAGAYDRLAGMEQGAALVRGEIGTLTLQFGAPGWAARVLGDSATYYRTRISGNGGTKRAYASYAHVLRLQGIARERLGDFAGALRALDEATRLAERLADRDDATPQDLARLAELALDRSVVHIKIGDGGEARRTIEKARTGFSKVKDEASLARVDGTLGLLELTEQRLPEAAAALGSCRAALLAANDEDGAARALHNLSIVWFSSGAPGKAAKGFRDAVAVFERLKLERELLDARYWLARVKRFEGDQEGALSALDELIKDATAAKISETLIDAFTERADLQYELGHFAHALQDTREALHQMTISHQGLGHGRSALARVPRSAVFEIGQRAAGELEDAQSFHFFHESGRAGALLASIQSREALREAFLPAELLQREADARLRVAAAFTALERARARRGNLARIRKLRREHEDCEDDLREVLLSLQTEAAAAADFLVPEAESLDSVRKALGHSDALVAYTFLPRKSFALVADATDVRVVKLPSSERVDAAVAALLAARKATGPKEEGGDDAAAAAAWKKASKALHAAVLAPLRLGPGVRRILVVPSQRLHAVPLGALGGAREVVYVPSGSTVCRLASLHKSTGTGVLAIGHPLYGRDADTEKVQRGDKRRLPPLEETGKEIAAVGTTVLAKFDATEGRFRGAVTARAMERWRSIHFACHGLVQPESVFVGSSLALTLGSLADPNDDGSLTALEAAKLDLKTDLVVLSACDSGLGKVLPGEGLMGFTRAFMLAGAPRLLVSLWKVDDEATRALMVKFYELWNPKDPGTQKPLRATDALRKAQAFVASHKQWKHPDYWAGWVLWGLPD